MDDLFSQFGTNLASGVTDSLSDAAPDIGYSAGSNAAQGALDTLSPYLPYILIGALLIVVLA